MKRMNIKDFIPGECRLMEYRQGNLKFIAHSKEGFDLAFLVPIADLDGCTITAEEKVSTLMKWIKIAIDDYNSQNLENNIATLQ